jgi:hypothetical protein
MEAEGLLRTRVVFDGDVVEVFQAARSIARVPLADIKSVRLDHGRKRSEMAIETTAGRVLTPDRHALPLAFSGEQASAAQGLADAINAAVRDGNRA